MTDDELNRIEQLLAIRLPQSYRTRMMSFPVPAAAGNSDLDVWDNAQRLIEFNLELRRGAPGGVKPWPSHFFAVGHPGDGCPRALDLREGDALWWVDHCSLENPGSYKEADSFFNWADEYFAVLREEMLGEGIDPDGTPEAMAASEAKSARAGAVGCLLMGLILSALAFGLIWLVRRLV